MKFNQEGKQIEMHSTDAGDGAELLVDSLERFDNGFGVNDGRTGKPANRGDSICVNMSQSSRDTGHRIDYGRHAL